MRVRTYDEINPTDAFRLSTLAFGDAWTNDMVRRVRARDRRYLDGFAMYAEERGRVLAQVVPLRFPVRLATGVEDVGGLASVCSHPAVWGRGYALRLMEAAHDRFRDLGLRISTLTTSRNIRGYRIYSKMGYADLGPFYRAVRRVTRPAPPRDVRLRRITASDLPTIHGLYRAYTRDLLGWTERPPEKISWAANGVRRALSKYKAILRREEVVGYLRTRPEAGITMEEVIAPDPKDFRAAVAAMEATPPGGFATVNWITAAKDARRFREVGYTVDGPIADATMAVPLTGGTGVRDLPRLFGATSGRFVQYPTDDF